MVSPCRNSSEDSFHRGERKGGLQAQRRIAATSDSFRASPRSCIVPQDHPHQHFQTTRSALPAQPHTAPISSLTVSHADTRWRRSASATVRTPIVSSPNIRRTGLAQALAVNRITAIRGSSHDDRRDVSDGHSPSSRQEYSVTARRTCPPGVAVQESASPGPASALRCTRFARAERSA